MYLQATPAAHSTLVTYGTPLRRWKALLGSRPIPDIKPSDISAAVAAVAADVTPRTLRSYVSVLRGVLALAIVDKVIKDNPADHIKYAKSQAREHDPLTVPEMTAVLKHLAKGSDTVLAFYEFAFATGLRPSEQIALRWGRIDWVRKTATIDTAHVRDRDKITKTGKVRHVELSGMAMAALTRMKAHTWMRGLDEHVFVNPRTARAWDDNEELRVRHWLPALKACGLRARVAYQTRHTYATTMLMAGANVAFIARQLGHSSVVMTLGTYAKWIDGADKGAQLAIADTVFGQTLVTVKPKHLKSLDK